MGCPFPDSPTLLATFMGERTFSVTAPHYNSLPRGKCLGGQVILLIIISTLIAKPLFKALDIYFLEVVTILTTTL